MVWITSIILPTQKYLTNGQWEKYILRVYEYIVYFVNTE